MQTYYDYTLRKWVTQQADGTVRDATNAEALYAYSNGAQAPVGSSGPALANGGGTGGSTPPPAVAPAVPGGGTGGTVGGPTGPGHWEQRAGVGPVWVPEAPAAPAPGTGPGHWQSPGGGQPPVWVPDPQTGGTGPPPVPADPYQSWLSGDPGDRSYRYFAPDLKQYYEQHPDEAYRQYTGSEFGDRQTPLSDYARGRYNDYWAQYIQASEGDPTGGAGWTDYLTNNLAGKIRQSFTMQSPSQKGYSLMFQPSGRVTGF